MAEDNVNVLWEMQPGETAAAYDGFCHYRDSGVTRSLRATRQALDRPWTTISDWSKKHRWVQRAAAFDQDQDRRRRLENEEAAREARERARRGAQLAQSIGLKAMTVLNQGRLTGAGQEPETNPPANALRYWREGVEMEFLALGLPISVIRQEVEAPTPEDLAAQEKAETYRRAAGALARLGA